MKPIIHYRPCLYDVIDEGLPAHLYLGTLDHPTLNNLGGPVITSRVLRIEGDSNPPVFETENSWYRPQEILDKKEKV